MISWLLRPWIGVFYRSWITPKKSSRFPQWLKNLKGRVFLCFLKKRTDIGVWSKSPSGRKTASNVGKVVSQEWLPITRSILLKSLAEPSCLLVQVKNLPLFFKSCISQVSIHLCNGSSSLLRGLWPILSFILAMYLKSPMRSHEPTMLFLMLSSWVKRYSLPFLPLAP